MSVWEWGSEREGAVGSEPEVSGLGDRVRDGVFNQGTG